MNVKKTLYYFASCILPCRFLIKYGKRLPYNTGFASWIINLILRSLGWLLFVLTVEIFFGVFLENIDCFNTYNLTDYGFDSSDNLIRIFVILRRTLGIF